MNHDPKGQGESPVLVKPLRRLRAFRVPENYVYDQILGYQLNEDKFNIYRIRPGTIPLDAKLVWIQFDPTKHDAYICLEHPSFPEYKPGTLCEEIPIELEEVSVMKEYFKGKEMWDWDPANKSVLEIKNDTLKIVIKTIRDEIVSNKGFLSSSEKRIVRLCDQALDESPIPIGKPGTITIVHPELQGYWFKSAKCAPPEDFAGTVEFSEAADRGAIRSGFGKVWIRTGLMTWPYWRYVDVSKETPAVEKVPEKEIIPIDTAEWKIITLHRPDPQYFGALEFTDDRMNIFFSMTNSADRTTLEKSHYWWRYYEPDRLKALVARDAAKTPLPTDGYQRGWRH